MHCNVCLTACVLMHGSTFLCVTLSLLKLASVPSIKLLICVSRVLWCNLNSPTEMVGCDSAQDPLCIVCFMYFDPAHVRVITHDWSARTRTRTRRQGRMTVRMHYVPRSTRTHTSTTSVMAESSASQARARLHLLCHGCWERVNV